MKIPSKTDLNASSWSAADKPHTMIIYTDSDVYRVPFDEDYIAPEYPKEWVRVGEPITMTAKLMAQLTADSYMVRGAVLEDKTLFIPITSIKFISIVPS